MRRILDAVQDNVKLMKQLEEIIYPCIVHSLTEDGLDSIEEGMDCLITFIHHGYKG